MKEKVKCDNCGGDVNRPTPGRCPADNKMYCEDCIRGESSFLKNLIKNNTVIFEFYRAGNLYYIVQDVCNLKSYRFAVPISDIGDATFLNEDKAILFMRYIRKAINNKEIEEIIIPKKPEYFEPAY